MAIALPPNIKTKTTTPVLLLYCTASRMCVHRNPPYKTQFVKPNTVIVSSRAVSIPGTDIFCGFAVLIRTHMRPLGREGSSTDCMHNRAPNLQV